MGKLSDFPKVKYYIELVPEFTTSHYKPSRSGQNSLASHSTSSPSIMFYHNIPQFLISGILNLSTVEILERVILCCGSLSQALQDAQQHPWPLPTRSPAARPPPSGQDSLLLRTYCSRPPVLTVQLDKPHRHHLGPCQNSDQAYLRPTKLETLRLGLLVCFNTFYALWMQAKF